MRSGTLLRLDLCVAALVHYQQLSPNKSLRVLKHSFLIAIEFKAVSKVRINDDSTHEGSFFEFIFYFEKSDQYKRPYWWVHVVWTNLGLIISWNAGYKEETMKSLDIFA